MKKILASILLAAAVPAMAWGDREQGALAGAVLGYGLSQFQQQRQSEQRPTQQPMARCGYEIACSPVYVEPPRTYQQRPIAPYVCRTIPVTNYRGDVIYYEQHCN